MPSSLLTAAATGEFGERPNDNVFPSSESFALPIAVSKSSQMEERNDHQTYEVHREGNRDG